MKYYLLLIITIFTVISCSKNQKSVNKLDGNWAVTKYNIYEDGKKTNLLKIGFNFNYYFDNCKLKKNNYCQLTTTTSTSNSYDTKVLIYKIVDNGLGLEITDPFTTKVINYYIIKKISRHKVKLTLNENTKTTEITLKKVN